MVESEFQRTAKEIGDLVTEKNKAYGDSFAKTGDFLKILYPDGIRPEQYGDALSLVRIFDKMMRIATDRDAFGESPYRDIAGYSLLGIVKNIRREEVKKSDPVRVKVYADTLSGDQAKMSMCPSCMDSKLLVIDDTTLFCPSCKYSIR